MGQKKKFRAVITDAGNGGAFVTIPFDVEQIFGEKRVQVKATLDGEPYRGSLVRMGGTCHILGVRKDIRQKIGKDLGDEIEVVVEKDTKPREAQVPQDMQEALKHNPEAAAFFKHLAYTHQKEYVQWIEEAKREQTRQRRIAQAVEMLKQGKRER